MTRSPDPLPLPRPVHPKFPDRDREQVVDLRASTAPEPMFSDPDAALLEVELLSGLTDPAATERTSAMLRNCVLTAEECGRMEWDLIARGYARIVEAATAAPTESRTRIARDAATVLSAAPDHDLRQQAAALLEHARDAQAAHDNPAATLDGR